MQQVQHTYNRIPLWGRLLAWLTIIVYTALTVGPLAWMIMSALKPHREIARNIMALPQNITFDNFTKAWQLGNFTPLFLNSVFYAFTTTVITVVLAISTGYAFSFIHSRLTKFFYSFILIGLLITVHSTLIPLFLMESFIGIDNTHFGVILPYVAFSLPFAIYLATVFIKDMPSEIIEAAKMDGASHKNVLLHIIFPICKPIAATIAIFTFLATWNEFVLIFTLTSDTLIQSLPIGINALAGGRNSDKGVLFASLVIGTLPMMIFYILFQKQLHKGFAGGAVKG